MKEGQIMNNDYQIRTLKKEGPNVTHCKFKVLKWIFFWGWLFQMDG